MAERSQLENLSLKLIAQQQEDISIISSLCQDALLSIKDLVFDQERQCVTMLLNRFCWEKYDPESVNNRRFFRTHTALEIHHVSHLYYAGFKKSNSDMFLNLLAIEMNNAAENNSIIFQFSKMRGLKVDISNLEIRLLDVGEAWPTNLKPEHSV